MGGILKNQNSRLLDAGGTADHVHLLISQSKNVSLSSLMKDLKKDSSLWIKTKGREFDNFHWQDGYGAFSIGHSQIAALKKYINQQKEHHRSELSGELMAFFDEYGMDMTCGTCGNNSTLAGR
jgi:REP element-mobilizing transposase RayT